MVLIITSITTYPEKVRYLSHGYFIGKTGNLYLNESLVGKVDNPEDVIGITFSGQPLRKVKGMFSYVKNDEVVTCELRSNGLLIMGIYEDNNIVSHKEEEYDDLSVETVLYFLNGKYIAYEIFAIEQCHTSNSNRFTIYKGVCYMVVKYAGGVSVLEETPVIGDEKQILRPCEEVYSTGDCIYAINGNTVFRLE